MIRRVALFVAWILFAPLAAQAQTAPVQIQFVGTITGSAADTLMVRQADGTLKPWTGPLPDFPYVKGDQISVAFSAQPGNAVQSADGLYRYTIIGPSQTGGATGSNYALAGPVDVSGPIAADALYQAASGLTLVFDANANTYSIEMPNGGYSIAEFGVPTLSYNQSAGSFSTISGGGSGCEDYLNGATGCYRLTGNMTSGAFNNIKVVDSADSSNRGLFSILFSGDWFVNGTKQGGGSTQVPEPGQLSLFALALAVLAWRLHARQLRRDQNNRA